MTNEGFANFTLSRNIRLGSRHYELFYQDALGNPICLDLVFDNLNFDKFGYHRC